MNNVVLKGKLGAGFNDDRYTLPKDGNPGDIAQGQCGGDCTDRAAHRGHTDSDGTVYGGRTAESRRLPVHDLAGD